MFLEPLVGLTFRSVFVVRWGAFGILMADSPQRKCDRRRVVVTIGFVESSVQAGRVRDAVLLPMHLFLLLCAYLRFDAVDSGYD